MKSQKQAVTESLLTVLNERGVRYEPNGEVIMNDILTPDDKAKARTILINGFKDRTIQLSEQARIKHEPNGFVSYTNGLLNNWIKKNKEFNNGIGYVPKNPGSRAGSGDESIRAMRALKKTTNDPAIIAEIDKQISERLAEIKPVQTVTIDVDALPESLRHLVK